MQTTCDLNRTLFKFHTLICHRSVASREGVRVLRFARLCNLPCKLPFPLALGVIPRDKSNAEALVLSFCALGATLKESRWEFFSAACHSTMHYGSQFRAQFWITWRVTPGSTESTKEWSQVKSKLQFKCCGGSEQQACQDFFGCLMIQQCDPVFGECPPACEASPFTDRLIVQSYACQLKRPHWVQMVLLPGIYR